MENSQSSNWYVAVTHGNAERLARYHLERQGFETYLPMIAGEKVVRPFLPKYIFVAIDMQSQRWRAVYSTIGIQSVLSAGERPRAINDIIIEKIKAREVGGLIVLDEPEEEFPIKRGERVKVKGSPIEAIFQEKVDKKRVAILLTLLNRQSRVVVPVAHVAQC